MSKGIAGDNKGDLWCYRKVRIEILSALYSVGFFKEENSSVFLCTRAGARLS